MAQVEAMAVRGATKFALEIGITKKIFEGDLEIIYRDLCNSISSLALHGHLIQDVKRLFSSFDSISFTHVRRQGNSVALGLAKWVIKSPNLTVWMENIPPDILFVVQADLASF